MSSTPDRKISPEIQEDAYDAAPQCSKGMCPCVVEAVSTTVMWYSNVNYILHVEELTATLIRKNNLETSGGPGDISLVWKLTCRRWSVPSPN